MGVRRDTACVVCGLFACVCAVAGEVIESAHHPLAEDRPGVVAMTPPRTSSADHTHEERGGFVALGSDQPGQGSTATPSDAPPPNSFYLDTALQVARRNFGRYYHPASLIFFPPPDHTQDEPVGFIYTQESRPVAGSGRGVVLTPEPAQIRLVPQPPQVLQTYNRA